MPQVITPIARSIFLCDYHFSADMHKDDLYGICNAVSVQKFPYKLSRLCIYAILSNGLGRTSIHFDIRDARTDELMRVTLSKFIHFPHRQKNVRLAMTIEGILFHQPGLYLFELYCNNTWVADTTLEVIDISKQGMDHET